MQKLGLLSFLSLILVGCSTQNTQQDNYLDASFELCNTEVRTYSVSDDGRVRIICEDDSKFTMNSEATLEIMRDINIDYCTGEGLSKFNESRRYYSFQCKSGSTISINKE
ncbi:hypothetical protein L3V77_13325 [Vibrio sp. DW001]|jgi:hypothetical protein|uniref:hypothetical protein n=1 Tax=unclassified Vibrio TaxID=2614977 RepID=UPI00189CE25F|nr:MULTISPECIES: hypothetical protein [unclassified Vibrio]UGA54128.1 hypothetical protein IUZ65_012765 [Vibrio sp. VB16]WED25999.1 hypothetical protein L3V77_13325 [Vibrio sp. DW001]